MQAGQNDRHGIAQWCADRAVDGRGRQACVQAPALEVIRPAGIATMAQGPKENCSYSVRQPGASDIAMARRCAVGLVNGLVERLTPSLVLWRIWVPRYPASRLARN